MAPRPHKYAFYLDENFPVAAGKFFAVRGHRVYDGKHLLGYGRSDPDHLSEATRKGAIVVSFDKDFRVNADLRASVKSSPGVILIQSTKADLNDVRVIIARLLKQPTPNQFSGKVCHASVDAIRYE